MCDDQAGDGGGEFGGAGVGGEDAREVGVALAVMVAHVHAAVEHDALPADGDHHAALPHLLPRPCARAARTKADNVSVISVKWNRVEGIERGSQVGFT
jgi:hypothetical protein